MTLRKWASLILFFIPIYGFDFLGHVFNKLANDFAYYGIWLAEGRPDERE